MGQYLLNVVVSSKLSEYMYYKPLFDEKNSAVKFYILNYSVASEIHISGLNLYAWNVSSDVRFVAGFECIWMSADFKHFSLRGEIYIHIYLKYIQLCILGSDYCYIYNYGRTKK